MSDRNRLSVKERLGSWFIDMFESYGALLEAAMIAGAACVVAIALFLLWRAAQ